MSDEEMDALRDKLNETTELAKVLFEQQFIRHGGRKPADPEWDDLEEVERDEWWDRALDAKPLIERERSSRQAWADMALKVDPPLATEDEVADIVSEFGGLNSFLTEQVTEKLFEFYAIYPRPRQQVELPHRYVCACVSDEQAPKLAPVFTRPVCAVHPAKPLYTRESPPSPGAQSAPYPADLYPGCPCYTCDSPNWPVDPTWGTAFSRRLSLCPTCGNKRCPGAADHRNDCSGSNEPGQAGSLYPSGAVHPDGGGDR